MRAAVGLIVVGVVVGAVVFAAGCATTATPTAPRARISLDEEVVDEAGVHCGRNVDVALGPLPAVARPIAHYAVTSTLPVPLEQMKATVRAAAKKRCPDGITILQAEVEEGGGDDVTAVRAVAYAIDDDWVVHDDG